MHLGVDFALQDLLGTGERDRRDFLAQMLARGGDLLLDVGACGGLDLVGLAARDILGFINDFIGALLRLVDDFLRLGLGFVKTLGNLFLRLFQVLLAAFGGGQALGDPRVALFQRSHQRWPYIFHAEPDKDHEGDHLPYQRRIEIHIAFLVIVIPEV